MAKKQKKKSGSGWLLALLFGAVLGAAADAWMQLNAPLPAPRWSWRTASASTR